MSNYQYVSQRVEVRDLKNGSLEIYDEQGICIAKHQALRNNKHNEGLSTGIQKKVAS